MRSVPRRWSTPPPDSALGRLLANRVRHPDEFDCALRVVSGELPGESATWRYRRSAVDPLMPEWDVVTLTHGTVTLRLRFAGDSRRPEPGIFARVRPLHRIWSATDVATGASVEVAVDPGEAVRFHLDV